MAHLIFLTSTPPTIVEGSGTWVGISVLRNAIIALGHQVTMITTSSSAAVDATFSRILFNAKAQWHLRGLAADVLIGFDLDGVFARSGNRFHVAAIKGVLADEAQYERGRSRLALAIQARIEARHVRRSDRVITTSLYSAERIAKFYGVSREKIFIVPELIDLDAWQGSLRHAALSEGPARVLCVAHLYPRKCIDTLLRAFARVQEQAILRIVGVGPEMGRLKQLANDLGIASRVLFLGHLPLERLIAEYRNAAIFALSSEQEGFGIVFLEAMASSLPIVAARAGAVPEVVEEGTTALLVDPRDDAALCDAIRQLLTEPDRRLAMGNAGNARVRRYDAPTVARQFLTAAGIATTTPVSPPALRSIPL
jgi:glycosyltransferase involved in cell wall biosynthesis